MSMRPGVTQLPFASIDARAGGRLKTRSHAALIRPSTTSTSALSSLRAGAREHGGAANQRGRALRRFVSRGVRIGRRGVRPRERYRRFWTYSRRTYWHRRPCRTPMPCRRRTSRAAPRSRSSNARSKASSESRRRSEGWVCRLHRSPFLPPDTPACVIRGCPRADRSRASRASARSRAARAGP